MSRNGGKVGRRGTIKIQFDPMTNLWYVGMIKQLWKNPNALSSLWNDYASHAAKVECFLRVSHRDRV